MASGKEFQEEMDTLKDTAHENMKSLEHLRKSIRLYDLQIQLCEELVAKKDEAVETLNTLWQSERSNSANLSKMLEDKEQKIQDLIQELKNMETVVEKVIANSNLWKDLYFKEKKGSDNLNAHVFRVQKVQKQLDESVKTLKRQSTRQQSELHAAVEKNKILSKKLHNLGANDVDMEKGLETMKLQIQILVSTSRELESRSKVLEGEKKDLLQLLESKDLDLEKLRKENSRLECAVGRKHLKQKLKAFKQDLQLMLQDENDTEIDHNTTYDLVLQCGPVLMHQSAKQKLNQMMKLKDENSKLKLELAEKEKQFMQAQSIILSMEVKYGERHRFDYEYDGKLPIHN